MPYQPIIVVCLQIVCIRKKKLKNRHWNFYRTSRSNQPHKQTATSVSTHTALYRTAVDIQLVPCELDICAVDVADRMPAGVSWGTYLRFATVAMLTMMAGSQTVHMIYRPLDVSHPTLCTGNNPMIYARFTVLICSCFWHIPMILTVFAFAHHICL